MLETLRSESQAALALSGVFTALERSQKTAPAPEPEVTERPAKIAQKPGVPHQNKRRLIAQKM